MGCGGDEAAVEIDHKVVAYTGKASYLTVEHLKSAEKPGSGPAEKEVKIRMCPLWLLCRENLTQATSSHSV